VTKKAWAEWTCDSCGDVVTTPPEEDLATPPPGWIALTISSGGVLVAVHACKPEHVSWALERRSLDIENKVIAYYKGSAK
jgi:hypothetical protein